MDQKTLIFDNNPRESDEIKSLDSLLEIFLQKINFQQMAQLKLKLQNTKILKFLNFASPR